MHKKNRIAGARVTLVAGTIAVVWRDPDTTFGGTSEVTVELEYTPQFVWCQRRTAGAGEGHVRITAITANGCTLTSSNAADTGQFDVFAVCRASDL